MRRNTTIRTDESGQAYTLEAIVAALLLVSSLIFALQVSAVTPLSASTSNQHIENQQRSTAAGALAAADESGALKDAVLYWDTDNETFWNPDGYDGMQRGAYTNEYPPNEFGDVLERSFGGRGLAVNVEVRYQTGPTSWSTQRMVYRGSPSDNAVTATRTVTLYDDDTITEPENWDADDPGNAVSTNDELRDVENEFYAGDESEESGVYNVVHVEVTVWRM